ncbi:MAG: hypothetical protein WEA34_06565 [Gemmatimonadota bacterium]
MRPRAEAVETGSRTPGRYRWIRVFAVIGALIMLVGCSDDIVAPGGGTTGDSAPERAIEVETRTVTAGPDGSAFIDLPARLGTLERPPSLVCSYTPDGENWWFAFGDKTCFIESVLADGTLRVRIGGLEEGWIFRVDAFPQSS